MKKFSFQKKITSVGSSAFQKNLQRLDQPTLVNFFGNEKIFNSKKNTSVGFNWCFDPIIAFFLEIKNFPFSKKLQVHFEKIYNDWISQHL